MSKPQVSLHPQFHEFFSEAEFKCKCGQCSYGFPNYRTPVINCLVEARIQAQVPFVITSAARCPAHNRKVGGSPSSSHMPKAPDEFRFEEVSAFDISTAADSVRAYSIMRALFKVGAPRIGWNQKAHFIHVDWDVTKPWGLLFPY